MKILSIETSCDETAISVVEATGDDTSANFSILGNALISQIDLHRQYGGVFPTLAKREHTKNIIPLTRAALEEAELLKEDTQDLSGEIRDAISILFTHEQGLAEAFFEFVSEIEPPEIDAIAVTAGPGLEPALWVGVNTAQALAKVWGKPLIAVNHMEGHIMTALAKTSSDKNNLVIENIKLPVLALLISGGHTELAVMQPWLSYEIVGATRDDAVGEAFDKVARLLGLPYPGGPEISRITEGIRMRDSSSIYSDKNTSFSVQLPRPMINDNTCDFSFAGLKTATRYLIQGLGKIDEETRACIALEFENSATEVLLVKTMRALEKTGAKTLVLGGGVSANENIRRIFTEEIAKKYPDVSLHIPQASLTTDNAIMIAIAGFYHARRNDFADMSILCANGNAPLAIRS